MTQTTTGYDASMHARDRDPTIGVHVLSEFVYCPRAGLIAYEDGFDDTGEEHDRPQKLDYLPDFSIPEIHDALQRAWNSLWSSVFWLMLAGLLISYVRSQSGFQVALTASIVLFPFLLFPAGKRVRDIVDLYCRLRIANIAAPSEPDATRMEVQNVSWWSLLKSGFDPVEYADAHSDMDWKLAGNPWRVLVKGSLRIPVFRKRFGEPELFPQHFVRMAAYCHLIESCEGAESPYGIVLFGDGADGVTVPNTVLNGEKLKDHLKQARRILKSAERDQIVPDRPRRSGPCQNCPLGRPQIHRHNWTVTQLNGQRVPPFLTTGKDGEAYHSECGDRFGWVPPHNEARMNKLL